MKLWNVNSLKSFLEMKALSAGGISVGKKATIYIRSNSKECDKLMNLMDENNIYYDKKNVTEDYKHMEELQEHGIFATPATFIDDVVILGYQENKLKQTLGTNHQSDSRASL